MAQKRVVFLHYHIFKNAGSSIDEFFRASPLGCTAFESSHPDHSVETDDLVSFIRANPGVGQITSHGIRPPRPEMPDCYLVDVVFLRQPVDRFRSIYDFCKATQFDGPTERAAKKFGLGDFAAWMAGEAPYNLYSPQTTFIGSRGEFFHPPNSSDLERAKERVRNVRMLGTVERYDDSMYVASRFLRPVAPQLDFLARGVVVNGTQGRASALEERLKRVRRDLGSSRYARLEEALREDLQLWECATAEVQRRHRLATLWGGFP